MSSRLRPVSRMTAQLSRLPRTKYATPDRIFGIRDLERREGQNRKFFFFEADRGTMPTERRDLSKSSYLRKIVSYAETYRRDLHTKRYGMSNVRVVTVTPGRQRIANII